MLPLEISAEGLCAFLPETEVPLALRIIAAMQRLKDGHAATRIAEEAQGSDKAVRAVLEKLERRGLVRKQAQDTRYPRMSKGRRGRSRMATQHRITYSLPQENF